MSKMKKVDWYLVSYMSSRVVTSHRRPPSKLHSRPVVYDHLTNSRSLACSWKIPRPIFFFLLLFFFYFIVSWLFIFSNKSRFFFCICIFAHTVFEFSIQNYSKLCKSHVLLNSREGKIFWNYSLTIFILLIFWNVKNNFIFCVI